ncbi:DUF4124 domain-containing protein [Shewanella aestuarii]|uniref:DUF4124 domain-containing protein n=1 Tax=Shewanella aestuarii TaxID=1028752 RepID=A0A6G9QPV6_9GAMM|nr:DUF4124 domain-containing protein [Shewanella aestuarii]QIR15859.1 DUF4124 domain-containing protein [Shewanella aestuarii]
MRILLILALLMVSISCMATVYRWVDENGKVHYSDEPIANAEVVELKDNTQNKIALKETRIESVSPQKEEAVQLEITIVSPFHEETIRDNSGNFDVTVSITPKLPNGVSLALFVDGTIKVQPQTSTVFQLRGIYRGEHTIVVKALDQNGKVLASSSPRKIFLHQASVGK